MKSKNRTLLNYIDDIICIRKHQNAEAEFNLFSLFEFLGVPINTKQDVPPTKALTRMCVIVDVDSGLLDLCCYYKTQS